MDLRPLAAPALLSLAVACTSTTAGLSSPDAADDAGLDAGLGGDAGGGLDAAVDRSDEAFPRDRLLRVEIELAPADWDALRAETRTLEDTLLRPECLSEPFASPFTYFPATVTIDGHRVEGAGVRKKGFLGSLSDTKPSLRLKLDRETAGANYLGISSWTLNNGRQDPTSIKPCLGFDVFRAAGVPAQRCGFAEVVVNGVSLGPYVNIETVNKRFLRRAFGSDDGHLYEGTLSDFREGWLGTFEQQSDEDVPYDRADLDGLTRALQADDAHLLDALAPWVDVDAFLAFWAAEVLVDHVDGYAANTNNFYVYRDPRDRRFRFVPSGIDGILGAHPPAPPLSVFAESLLARRLYLHPDVRPRYVQKLQALLRTAWDPEALVREIDGAYRVIWPAVPVADRPSVAAATDDLRTFVRGRRAALYAELDQGGADWTRPLRDPLCFEDDPLVASLHTTFGTHPAQNIFATGTGTFTATIAGAAVQGTQVGSSSGMGTNPDDRADAVLLLAATTASGAIPIVYVALPPELLRPGIVGLDGTRVRGALLRFPRAGGNLEMVGSLWRGYLEIRAGGDAPGATVDVTVRAAALAQRRP